jgi:hypothetical protein
MFHSKLIQEKDLRDAEVLALKMFKTGKSTWI